MRRGHLHLAPEQMHVRRDRVGVEVAADRHRPRRADFMAPLAGRNRERPIQGGNAALPLVDRSFRKVQPDARPIGPASTRTTS
jgi:hypothetical protein